MEWREFAARCTQGAGARHKMGKQNAPAALGPESSLGLLPTIRTEAWELSKLASPIMIVSMLQFLMVMVDMGMVGRLGTDELAASALANAYFNCLQHPLVGCATALDTLLAQSYGANQKISYGQWAKVGVLTLLTLSIPVMGMLIVAEPLLLLIGQDSHLSERAGMFCRLLVPGVMPFFGFIGTSKYLQAQNILAPAVWIALFANGMNVFLNWLLIYGLEFGFEGAPVATSLSRWAQFLCLLCYLFYSRAQHAETIPSWRDPEGLSLAARVRKFIKLGAPGALMLGLEAWSFEATTLLSGLIGTVPLAAHMVRQRLSPMPAVPLLSLHREKHPPLLSLHREKHSMHFLCLLFNFSPRAGAHQHNRLHLSLLPLCAGYCFIHPRGLAARSI